MSGQQTGNDCTRRCQIAAAVLAYENSIVRPDDLSRVNVAFFTLNGLVSLALGAAIVLNAVFPSG